MAGRVLTQRELNRALLARQLLLERVAPARSRARSSGSAASRTSTRRTRTSASGRASTASSVTRSTAALERRIGRSGDAHARHDPPRLCARLLAVRGRDPQSAATVVAARPQAAFGARRPRCGKRGVARARGRDDAQPRRDRRAPARVRSAGCAGRARMERRRRRARSRAAVGNLERSVARTRSRSPRTGSALPPSTRTRRSSTWRVATWPASGLRRATTSPTGPASPCRSFTPVLERMRLRRFRDEKTAASYSTCRARRFPIPRRPRRSVSCRRGTRRCSSTRGAPASCPSVIGRASSTRRRRTRSGRFSSTAPSRARGASTAIAFVTEPFERLSREAGVELRRRGRAPRRVPSLASDDSHRDRRDIAAGAVALHAQHRVLAAVRENEVVRVARRPAGPRRVRRAGGTPCPSACRGSRAGRCARRCRRCAPSRGCARCGPGTSPG